MFLFALLLLLLFTPVRSPHSAIVEPHSPQKKSAPRSWKIPVGRGQTEEPPLQGDSQSDSFSVSPRIRLFLCSLLTAASIFSTESRSASTFRTSPPLLRARTAGPPLPRCERGEPRQRRRCFRRLAEAGKKRRSQRLVSHLLFLARRSVLKKPLARTKINEGFVCFRES